MEIAQLGQKLTTFRKDAGLSMERLAQLSGVAKNAINDLENGRGNPTVKTLHALALALGVALVEFLGKYRGLTPSLKALACAVVYKDPKRLRALPRDAYPALQEFLEVFQKQLRLRAR